jgi:hypothetical protein
MDCWDAVERSAIGDAALGYAVALEGHRLQLLRDVPLYVLSALGFIAQTHFLAQLIDR